MSEPVIHRAILKHREVMAAAMAVRSRAISLPWLYVVLILGLLLAVWAGHLFAFWFVQQLPFEWMFAIGAYLPTVIPALFAWFAVVLVARIQNRAIGRAYLRNMAKLGIPLEGEVLYEVLPEGLRLTSDRITIFPRWEAVDTLERVPQGWALSADQLTFLIPRDSFDDEAAEKALIAAIFERMSRPAQERSRGAASFAAAS